MSIEKTLQDLADAIRENTAALNLIALGARGGGELEDVKAPEEKDKPVPQPDEGEKPEPKSKPKPSKKAKAKPKKEEPDDADDEPTIDDVRAALVKASEVNPSFPPKILRMFGFTRLGEVTVESRADIIAAAMEAAEG